MGRTMKMKVILNCTRRFHSMNKRGVMMAAPRVDSSTWLCLLQSIQLSAKGFTSIAWIKVRLSISLLALVKFSLLNLITVADSDYDLWSLVHHIIYTILIKTLVLPKGWSHSLQTYDWCSWSLICFHPILSRRMDKSHCGKTFWEGLGVIWWVEQWVRSLIHRRPALPYWSLSGKRACTEFGMSYLA
jgi:hypothetical protein